MGASSPSTAVAFTLGLMTILAACSQSSPLSQGGPGSSETARFELEQGSYILGWSVSAQTPAGCRIDIQLVTEDDGNVVARAKGTLTAGRASQGSEPLPDLGAGGYRMRTDSTCESWSAVVGEAMRRTD